MSFLRLLPQRLHRLIRQVEQDVETVIHVLQPGPIGIVEHKFTDAEILEARATVKRAVDNWRMNWTLERNLGSASFDKCFASLVCHDSNFIDHKLGGPSPVHLVKVLDLVVHLNHARPMSTATASKVPVGARKVGLKVVMMSPGFVYEPYSVRERIPFWKRWFTISGWRRTKEDIILEMKNAYAVSRLRKKTGYTKRQFYDQAFKIYKEVNTLMAQGETSALRKILTERMYSTIKNELKRRQSMWHSVHWELLEPAVSIKTLRARMIGLDKKDLDKAFIQLTLEFVTKQKFEAYNSKGDVVSGDKSNEVLVKDIWVFERSLFHPGAYWRVCGRITL